MRRTMYAQTKLIGIHFNCDFWTLNAPDLCSHVVQGGIQIHDTRQVLYILPTKQPAGQLAKLNPVHKTRQLH